MEISDNPEGYFKKNTSGIGLSCATETRNQWLKPTLWGCEKKVSPATLSLSRSQRPRRPRRPRRPENPQRAKQVSGWLGTWNPHRKTYISNQDAIRKGQRVFVYMDSISSIKNGFTYYEISIFIWVTLVMLHTPWSVSLTTWIKRWVSM